MKISIITPDLSHNCLGRAYILAKALQSKYDVEIAGPILGNGIWEPVAGDKGIIYKAVKLKGNYSFRKLKDLYYLADGNIIYCSKPLFTSFGISLMKKYFTRKPLILDIDDWELGFKKKYTKSNSLRKRLKYFFFDSIIRFYKNDSYWSILLLEKLICKADRITVSNKFLQNKFGGTLIWHGRDERLFDPEKFSSSSLKKKHGIKDNSIVIIFLGTPKPHKGLEDLIEAVQLNRNKNVLLVIVGFDNKIYCKDLRKQIENKLTGRNRLYGIQDFKKIPEFLSMADIVVIPQTENLSTIGQMPSKIFDAMAMGKPIISTRISNIAEILHNCALLVEPGNPQKISEAIDQIIDEPEKAVQMGARARKKFLTEYRWNKMVDSIVSVIEEVKLNLK
jgi:glycosyltransferase involved in cell wall biosynthesis